MRLDEIGAALDVVELSVLHSERGRPRPQAALGDSNWKIGFRAFDQSLFNNSKIR